MLEIEKFRVGLSQEAKGIIIRDSLIFRLVKKNGEANLNKFMNLFVERFCPYFTSKFSEFVAMVNESGGNESKVENTIHDFFFQSSDEDTFRPAPKGKKENLAYITFTLSYDNLSRLEHLLNIVGGTETYSLFFREYINEYINYPSFARERLIYSSTYETLQKAIKEHKKIRFDINRSTNSVGTPYSVEFGSDRSTNFLVVYNILANNGEIFRPVSIASLFKIRNLVILNEPAENPTEEALEKINRMTSNGVEFYYQDDELPIKVLMNEEAVELFNRKAELRPRVVSIEGDIYTFDCTYRQFIVYFSSFLAKYKVLEPQILIDKLKDFYKEKLDTLK